jgi:nitroreductase
MHLMDVITQRESVREYLDRDVEPEKLTSILEAGRLAPSAGNRQQWRYVVVKEGETRKKLMKAAGGQSFVAQAPVVIAACAVNDNHIMTCGQSSYPIDVAISVDHMTLKAVEEGLGTCWIGHFDETAAKAALGIPGGDDVRIVQLLTVGYPAVHRGGKTRLSLDEIVHYERWE